MRKYYIKIITGFREDQQISIPMQEAHKAYYLFMHPDERGIFSNGLALIGKNIQEIKPDWNATMGWNTTHEIDELDFIQIRKEGVENKMRILLEEAKDFAKIALNNPKIINERLQDLLENKKTLLLN